MGAQVDHGRGADTQLPRRRRCTIPADAQAQAQMYDQTQTQIRPLVLASAWKSPEEPGSGGQYPTTSARAQQ